MPSRSSGPRRKPDSPSVITSRQPAHPRSDYRGHRTPSPRAPRRRSSPAQRAAGTGRRWTAAAPPAPARRAARRSPANPRSRAPPAGRGQIGTVTHQQQTRRYPFADAAKQLDHHAGPLHRSEVRDVNHELRVGRATPVACRQTLVGNPPVVLTVEEVGNDLDPRPHRQLPVGIVAQAGGNGGNAVRLVDGERNRLQVGRIASDQGDVCAVQRGDDPRNMAVARSGEDLPGEIGGGRMRHRVVRMNDVESAFAANLDDLVGQRQQVLRLPEQRIAGCADAVESQSGLEIAQPHRRLAAD